MDAVLKILVVDDNYSITSSMPFIFASPRYNVATSPDGIKALAKLAASPDAYDVIIVDQKMPSLTGTELVQEIKTRGIAGKIMVLSAHLSPEIRQAYEQMGVPTMLEKPFNIEELRSAVDRLAA